MKASKILAIALCILAAATKAFGDDFTSCDHGDMNPNCNYKAQDEWTFMVLAQTWEGTFCNDGCCVLPSSISKLTSGVTIHGLWPNYDSGYPSCCKCSYTETEVDNYINNNAQMYRDINTYWPSLKKCKFIHYEWAKHGTCAASVYNGDTGYADYFNTAITLHKKWNLYSIITSAVTPSNTTKYPASKITSAIEKKVGTSVALSCSSGKLAEIRICFEHPTSATKLNPNPINCSSSIWNGCTSSSTIIVPPALLNLDKGTCNL